jgi:hypothetical protein
MATLQFLWAFASGYSHVAIKGRHPTRAPFHTTHRDADATQHGGIAAGPRLRGCSCPRLCLHPGATHLAYFYVSPVW